MGEPKLAGMIGDQDYARLCKILYQVTGIHLGERKQSLVESRLSKRLQALKFVHFEQYVNYLEKNLKQESQFLVEAMTTHKTEWFRENVHYDFLKNHLHEFPNRPLYLWSAACSTGEELWTMAMILNSCGVNPAGYRLFGSDISGDVVKKASQALYSTTGFQAPPVNAMTQEFFKVRKDLTPTMLEVQPQFRETAKFKTINLIQVELPQNLKFDFIFLRNVLIYFDPESTKKVVSSLVSHLRPGGYLILGLSETLRELPPNLKSLGQSIYQLSKTK